MSALGEVATERSLGDLAGAANREHAAAEAAAKTWLDHAISAGEALLEAKGRIPYGEWWDWLERNVDFCAGTAAKYIRVATYKDLAAESPDHRMTSILAYLRNQPEVPNKRKGDDDPRVVEARRLVESGMTQTEVGEIIGVNQTTVSTWMDPKRMERARKRARERARERAKERRALEDKRRREERDRAAKRAGGAVSHAYSHLRKTLTHLQAAIDEAEDRSAEAALREAMGYLHKANDEIYQAIRTQA